MTPRNKIEPQEAERVAEILRIDFAVTEFDADQFRAGMEVELEHGTTDPDTNVTDDDLVPTGKIALAHLNEFSDYYVRLALIVGPGESPSSPGRRVCTPPLTDVPHDVRYRSDTVLAWR